MKPHGIKKCKLENKKGQEALVSLCICNIRGIQSFSVCTFTFWNFSDYSTLSIRGKLCQYRLAGLLGRLNLAIEFPFVPRVGLSKC